MTDKKASDAAPKAAAVVSGAPVNAASAINREALLSRARAVAHEEQKGSPGSSEHLWPALARQALQELRVHQIELEMQNEELRRNQMKLDAERERYFDLYDLAPVGYISVSEQDSILEINLGAVKLLGSSRRQLLSQRFSQFIERQHQDSYYLARKQLLASRQTQSFDLQMLGEQGRPLWVKLIASVVQKDGGDEIRIVLSDISERKQAEIALEQSERALRISERQMEIVQRISATGSWTYNLATGEIFGSSEGMHIFGFPPVAGSLPIGRFEACIAGQDRQRVHESLMALIADEGEYDLEFSVMPADGSAQRITHSIGVLERDATGKPALVLGFVQDITERKRMEQSVRQLAFFDPLTALPNRRLLLDRLGQASAAAERSDVFGALLYLDLDNFKPLNDRYGHDAGDLLLQVVARRLKECVREVDTVSRVGGDEFVVVLAGLVADPSDARERAGMIAEKVRLALAMPYLLDIQQKGTGASRVAHDCSASIGVVLFSKQHRNLEGIVKWADAAMYRSKEDGGNRVTFMIERRTQQRP